MAADGLVLYTNSGNKNSYKALIAAEYANIKLDVPSDFQFGETNKTPEFLKLNPAGKVPTLKTSNGGIFESNAIARYVARLSDTGLFGDTLLDTALVESWIDFSTTELDGPLASWAYPHFGIVAYDKKKEAAAQQALKKALGVLDAYLKTRTYLVGDAVTLADIIVFANLWLGYTKMFDPEFRKPFPNVLRFWQTLAAQPQFSKVVGSWSLPTEVVKPPAAKESKAKDTKPKAAKQDKEGSAAKQRGLQPPQQKQQQRQQLRRLSQRTPCHNCRRPQWPSTPGSACILTRLRQSSERSPLEASGRVPISPALPTTSTSWVTTRRASRCGAATISTTTKTMSISLS